MAEGLSTLFAVEAEMLEILRFFAIPLAIVLTFVLVRIALKAKHDIPELSRARFSLGTWLTGKGLRDEGQAAVRSGHGLMMRIERGPDGKKRRIVVDETINLSNN